MKTYDYNHCRTSSPYNLPDVYDTQDLETFSQVDQQIANAIVSVRNKKTVDYVISNENTRNPNHVYIQVDSKESLDRKNKSAYLLKLYSATTTTIIAYFSLKAFYGYVKSK